MKLIDKKELEIPKDFLLALKKKVRVYKNFGNLPYSHKRAYIDWINDAKKLKTRQERIEQTIIRLKSKFIDS